jgi:hypothetical protein
MNSVTHGTVQRPGIQVLRSMVCLELVAAIKWIALSMLNVNGLIAGFAYVTRPLLISRCKQDTCSPSL